MDFRANLMGAPFVIDISGCVPLNESRSLLAQTRTTSRAVALQSGHPNRMSVGAYGAVDYSTLYLSIFSR